VSAARTLEQDRDYWRESARFEHKRFWEQCQFATRLEIERERDGQLARQEIESLERQLELARAENLRLLQLKAER
jgi:hypothetical protein